MKNLQTIRLKPITSNLRIFAIILLLNLNINNSFAQFQGFENWTADSIVILKDYNTTPAALKSITQSIDAQDGNYALKVETIKNSTGDTSYGFVISGDPSAGLAGQATSLSNVDSIIGYYKSDVKPGDSVLLLCLIYTNKTSTGGGLYYLKGTHSSWTRFAFSANAATSDSITIGIISADAAHNSKGLPGTWLLIDNIQLKAFNGTLAPILNYSFEVWDKFKWETPIGWNSTSARIIGQPFFPVVKSTEAYSGASSIELTTRNNIQTGEKILAIATNGILGNAGITGGQAISGAPSSIEFYYKYAPIGSDSAFLHFDFHFGGATSEKMSIGLSTTPTYTKFTRNLVATNADSFLVILFAGATPGSKLKVDDINLVYKVGLTNTIKIEKLVSYPNPVKGELKIKFSILEPSNISIKLTDHFGKELYHKSLGTLETGEYTETFNTSSFDSGLYFLEVTTGMNSIINRFIIK